MSKPLFIVGVCGLAGSGKDTLAGYLLAQGFQRVAFADPLKQEVAAAFNVTVDFLNCRETKEVPSAHLRLRECRDFDFTTFMLEAGYDLYADLSPRVVMQQWGTGYRRSQQDDYWLSKLVEHTTRQGGRFVVTDCRFRNEARLIESLGGHVVRIVRDGRKVSDDAHPSERELADWPAWLVVESRSGDFTALERAAQQIAEAATLIEPADASV